MSHTIDTLIKRLKEIKKKYGNIEIHMLTETEKTGQVQQPVNDLAVATDRNLVQTTEGVVVHKSKIAILLPKGF
jgi:hypothetical protein